MDSFPEDLWAMVLARLPLKIFTGFKLVCKQWKSIIETSFFRDLFISVHQNSASSSWSLMFNDRIFPEIVAHYQCDIWGLEQSLGSCIESFLTNKSHKDKNRLAKVEAYSDAGLILIHEESIVSPYYVANPISRECIKISLDPLHKEFETRKCVWQWGIATRTENGVLLDYKVVLTNRFLLNTTKLSCLIYSSQTGLCSQETFDLPSFSIYSCFRSPVSLNGSLYWLASNTKNHEAVLSIDLYDGSTRCRFTPFPDLEITIKYPRACTPCQGFLMYMNIVGGATKKICLWRLQSEGWQQISKISIGFILADYLPLTINPFDAETAYFWSMEQQHLLYFNLHNGKSVIHSQLTRLERRGHDHFMVPISDPRAMISLHCHHIGTSQANFIQFVLPRWLYRIPNTVRRV
ncbi:hypothetical protein N665_0613s0030 [Sinapis alba]|nr:hypothetical protein N665_0613s0030 [Sinapis alba]